MAGILVTILCFFILNDLGRLDGTHLVRLHLNRKKRRKRLVIPEDTWKMRWEEEKTIAVKLQSKASVAQGKNVAEVPRLGVIGSQGVEAW